MGSMYKGINKDFFIEKYGQTSSYWRLSSRYAQVSSKLDDVIINLELYANESAADAENVEALHTESIHLLYSDFMILTNKIANVDTKNSGWRAEITDGSDDITYSLINQLPGWTEADGATLIKS